MPHEKLALYYSLLKLTQLYPYRQNQLEKWSMFQKTPGKCFSFLQENVFQVLMVDVVPSSAYKSVLNRHDPQMWALTTAHQCLYGRTHV